MELSGVSNLWDIRFLDITVIIAAWSKDPSTKTGATVVRPDKTIASMGFNGFPKKCLDNEALYLDRNEKYSRIIHAELNAILHAREPLTGYTMYTYQEPMIGHSCDRCTAHIIQAGITRVVTFKAEVPKRWQESINRGLQMYKEAGIEVVTIG